MKSFSEFALAEELQASLERLKFTEPTVIQHKAIPILLETKDLIACSETGSGKTAAYGIPMVQKLLENNKQSALVLAPTRELALQIAEFLESLVRNVDKFIVTKLVGGQDIRKQFKQLQRKPRIIVATPGRLIDHLKRNTVQIHKTETLVLDEGDRMIDMGFAPQLHQILEFLPEQRQTSFFTATLNDKVKKLASKYLKNPKHITVGGSSRPVSTIEQNVVQVELKDKDECVLNELIKCQGSVIIFVKTKYRTDRLAKYLDSYGVPVERIHGGRTQGQRNSAIRKFKQGKARVLCATDVAARGIDVPQVEHVINFDLPMQDEDYVHRIGRTGRNGASGEAISFVSLDEHSHWNRLVRKYEIKDALLPEEPRSKKKLRVRKKSGKSSGKKAARGGKKKSFGRKKSSGKKSTSKSTRGKKSNASGGSRNRRRKPSRSQSYR